MFVLNVQDKLIRSSATADSARCGCRSPQP